MLLAAEHRHETKALERLLMHPVAGFCDPFHSLHRTALITTVDHDGAAGLELLQAPRWSERCCASELHPIKRGKGGQPFEVVAIKALDLRIVHEEKEITIVI